MQDVALAAGVGVATVDRVINRRAPVRAETAQRVLEAAEQLGFRRAGLIRRRINEERVPVKFGVLLQSRRSPFYAGLATALRETARTMTPAPASVLIEHLEDLTPRRVAERLTALGQQVDALAVVAADHPQIAQAIQKVHASGVPVFAWVSDLTDPAVAGYVGVDNRQMGATAAWFISHLCPPSGKVALILGSHRYLCQEQCEVSFRSWLREQAPGLTLLETLVSLEDGGLARATALELLHRHPDLAGIYVAGGGIEGVLEALDEARPPQLVTVCHDLTEVTRQALLDGRATVVLSHPREWMAQRLFELMLQAVHSREPHGKWQGVLPFTVHTSANI